MTIELFGALMVAGLAGPLLRIPRRWGVPVAVGELLIGALLGTSGFNKIPVADPTLKLLATVGFALLMFTAGSHIDYRTFTKSAFSVVYKIIVANAVLAVALGFAMDYIAHFPNWRLLATLSFSSSAAFVIPIVAFSKKDLALEILIAQVTIADALSFIALPFFTQKQNQLGALEGSLIVLVSAIAIFILLTFAKSRGYLDHTHDLSKEDHLGLELRISLALLLLVAALATHFHASVMIAGFALGVVLASIGVPHRLARQLFGVSDGLFAPLYFIWLGASINIRDTFHSRDTIILAIALILAAFAAHAPALFFKQSASNVMLASGQLGIPAAAITLGAANGLLTPAQSGAIMLAALITLTIPSVLIKTPDVVIKPEVE
jgi:Kef-type K+ transport system membrane component KefB